MIHKTKYLALVLGTLLAVATTSSAIPLTVNSTTYNITTVTGSFNDLRDTLQSQPWWEQSFHFDLANALGNQLGTPNQVNLGRQSPLFAWLLYGNPDAYTHVQYSAWFDFFGAAASSGTPAGSTTTVWAIVSPDASVPESGPTILLFGGAFVGLASLRRHLRIRMN